MPSLWRCRWPTSAERDRHALHRTRARWLDTDHYAQRKPWSWVADGSRLRIGLLDDQLTDRLLSGAAATGIPLEQLATVKWSELRGGPPGENWCVDFLSPVTFRRGNRFLPWPAPSAVFGGLRATWRHFGAPEVGDLELDLKLACPARK
jgi:hypothetical protein